MLHFLHWSVNLNCTALRQSESGDVSMCIIRNLKPNLNDNVSSASFISNNSASVTFCGCCCCFSNISYFLIFNLNWVVTSIQLKSHVWRSMWSMRNLKSKIFVSFSNNVFYCRVFHRILRVQNWCLSTLLTSRLNLAVYWQRFCMCVQWLTFKHPWLFRNYEMWGRYCVPPWKSL